VGVEEFHTKSVSLMLLKSPKILETEFGAGKKNTNWTYTV
jgi:hypothetical protein